ncbi:hypothetical protein [uncultured Ilyobacter sp.]|uniref:hypothetical protein n=1 Tax=uncultured Ilyobacter sp. TaxID=544433 RepID=UPI0029C71816|nr:hypothetical protein [uncultured Ilyobacter sp.]
MDKFKNGKTKSAQQIDEEFNLDDLEFDDIEFSDEDFNFLFKDLPEEETIDDLIEEQSRDNFIDDNLEKIRINFLKKISGKWIEFEQKKKLDRRFIGYGLLGVILLQLVALYYIIFAVCKGSYTISPAMFNFFVSGVFVEVVGLFYIVIKSMFKDDGDQVLESILALLKQNDEKQ